MPGKPGKAVEPAREDKARSEPATPGGNAKPAGRKTRKSKLLKGNGHAASGAAASGNMRKPKSPKKQSPRKMKKCLSSLDVLKKEGLPDLAVPGQLMNQQLS